MLKKCPNCKQEKELNDTNFPKNKNSSTGFDYQCKECKKAYYQRTKEHKKRYYEEHKDKVLEYRRTYYAANKEKCLALNSDWQRKNKLQRRLTNERNRTRKFGNDSDLSQEEWLKIKAYFDNSCAYCGMTEKEHEEKYGESLHHEHVTPLVRGGSYSYGNVVLSCRSCNSSKANNWFDIWYPESKVYSEYRMNKILSYVNGVERG